MEGKKGASRRGHKKSKNGCKTCVRRHIRCDETFPRCHNCTYRNLPCQYASAPPHSSQSPANMIERRERGFVNEQMESFLDEASATYIPSVDDSLSHKSLIQLYNHLRELKLLGFGMQRGPGIGLMDPFNTLSVTANPQVNYLLSHLDKFVRHSRGLPGPREGWLSFAVSDSAVLPMILFIAALDIAGLRGKSDSPDIMYWKGETIRAINDRFGDSKKMATDGTIAAVASLAHLENLAGTPESARVHAAGLEALVKSRGGLHNLGEHEMPRRIVSWSDICTSIILESKPRYDPGFIRQEKIVADQGPPSTLTLSHRSKVFKLTGSYELSEELVALHEELQILSRLKEQAACTLNGGEEIENIPFTDTADHLERRLLPLTQLEPLSNPSQAGSISTTFAYAAIIHMLLFIRDCSKDLPFSHLLSSRIRTVLEKVDMRQLETQFPEMMLWILIMGGLSGSPSLERVWFANHAAHLCRKLGIWEGNQITSMLADFLWSELYRSPVTEGFWIELAKAQGCVEGYEVRRMADYVSLVYFNAPADFKD